MNKVVVLGALGMAGHIMAEYLDKTGDYEVFGIARQPGRYIDAVLDVTDFGTLHEYLENIGPAYVINCVGALVAHARDRAADAILLNSYLPHFLADLGKRLDFKLIHISTDCVFSGKEGGYREDSFRDGDDNYARSKALGEVINDRDLTIRTSIIGPELKNDGTGLLDWFLKQQSSANGYTKAFWSGVTTLELAKATHEMIRQNITGLYQLCPKDKISKYDLLKLFARIWNKQIEIIPYEGHAVDKSLVCTRTEFSYPALTYETMLLETKEWMNAHPDYYSQYKI